MPHLSIPISKKQHDAINAEAAEVRAHQQTLQIAANTILMGRDEDAPTTYGILGARCDDGVYVMVIEIPDPTAPAQGDSQ